MQQRTAVPTRRPPWTWPAVAVVDVAFVAGDVSLDSVSTDEANTSSRAAEVAAAVANIDAEIAADLDAEIGNEIAADIGVKFGDEIGFNIGAKLGTEFNALY